MVEEKINIQIKEVEKEDNHSLILFNDEFNTFDYVIESLVDICDFDEIRAEQCAMIAHYKGKCGVLSGGLDDLIVCSNQLTEKGLTVEIK